MRKKVFFYYLQNQECPKKNKTKIKVSKWLDVPDLKNYEDFAAKWHFSFKKTSGIFWKKKEEEQLTKDLNMYVLNLFIHSRLKAEETSMYSLRSAWDR